MSENQLSHWHRTHLELIKVSEDLQEHFNEQIMKKRKLRDTDPVVSVVLSGGVSAIEVGNVLIYNSAVHGMDTPSLEWLIEQYESEVDNLLEFVRPGKVQTPDMVELIADTSNLVVATVNLCHCTRDLIGKANRQQAISKDLWDELQQLTGEAEAAFEKARTKRNPGAGVEPATANS